MFFTNRFERIDSRESPRFALRIAGPSRVRTTKIRVFGEGVKSARGETAILGCGDSKHVWKIPSHNLLQLNYCTRNSRKNAIVLRPLRAIASHELLHELLRQANNYCTDSPCGIHPFSEHPKSANTSKKNLLKIHVKIGARHILWGIAHKNLSRTPCTKICAKSPAHKSAHQYQHKNRTKIWCEGSVSLSLWKMKARTKTQNKSAPNLCNPHPQVSYMWIIWNIVGNIPSDAKCLLPKNDSEIAILEAPNPTQNTEIPKKTPRLHEFFRRVSRELFRLPQICGSSQERTEIVQKNLFT